MYNRAKLTSRTLAVDHTRIGKRLPRRRTRCLSVSQTTISRYYPRQMPKAHCKITVTARPAESEERATRTHVERREHFRRHPCSEKKVSGRHQNLEHQRRTVLSVCCQARSSRSSTTPTSRVMMLIVRTIMVNNDDENSYIPDTYASPKKKTQRPTHASLYRRFAAGLHTITNCP